MKLKSFQKKYLKSLAHDMKPNVIIGKSGLTIDVIDKIDSDLSEHELLKIKLLSEDDLQVEQAATYIKDATSCEIVKVIGKTAVLFRENKDNKKPYFKACGKYGKRSQLNNILNYDDDLLL